MVILDGELFVEFLFRKELVNRIVIYERSLVMIVLRWVIWFFMCVVFGIYLVFYVVWFVNLLERIRMVLLFVMVEKIGFNGGWFIFCFVCECVDFKFFFFVGFNWGLKLIVIFWFIGCLLILYVMLICWFVGIILIFFGVLFFFFMVFLIVSLEVLLYSLVFK